MSKSEYKGWKLCPPDFPIPWTAYGPNYDASYEGEEDGWVDNGEKASANTREQLIEEIDIYCEENGWGECPMHGAHDQGGCLKC